MKKFVFILLILLLILVIPAKNRALPLNLNLKEKCKEPFEEYKIKMAKLESNDNYIIVKCNLDSFTTDFTTSALICNDNSTTECISNEAVANTYN